MLHDVDLNSKHPAKLLIERSQANAGDQNKNPDQDKLNSHADSSFHTVNGVNVIKNFILIISGRQCTLAAFSGLTNLGGMTQCGWRV